MVYYKLVNLSAIALGIKPKANKAAALGVHLDWACPGASEGISYFINIVSKQKRKNNSFFSPQSELLVMLTDAKKKPRQEERSLTNGRKHLSRSQKRE